jgi:2-methylcitrate dehydratase PrpD
MAATAEGLTRECANFAAGLTAADLPSAVVRTARRCLLDTLAVAIAGTETDLPPLLLDHLRLLGAAPQARVFGRPDFRVNAPQAAFLFGSIANALDWDDVQNPEAPNRPFGLLMHASVPVLGAALAVADLVAAESRASVDGGRLLAAFVAGHEVSCKIAVAINPDHYYKGFHTSGTIGTFGAGVAAAKLLGLDAAGIARTIGIAASLAGGIRASLGTQTKPLHVGWAAEKGVTAALLARAGLTSSQHGLDGEFGYLAVAGRGADMAFVRGRIGRPFVMETPGISFKPYPCGAVTHPGMEALRLGMQGADWHGQDIEHILIRAGANVWGPIGYARASTALEGKYCFPFLLAAIALRGRCGRSEFHDAFVTSPEVQALQARIENRFDAAIDARGYETVYTELDVTLRDGRRFTLVAVPDYRGSPLNPMSDEDLAQKFRDATENLLSENARADVQAFIARIDTLGDVAPLIALIGNLPGMRA